MFVLGAVAAFLLLNFWSVVCETTIFTASLMYALYNIVCCIFQFSQYTLNRFLRHPIYWKIKLRKTFSIKFDGMLPETDAGWGVREIQRLYRLERVRIAYILKWTIKQERQQQQTNRKLFIPIDRESQVTIRHLSHCISFCIRKWGCPAAYA